MTTRKVRVNSLYAYYPVLMDRCHPPAGEFIEDGQIVRVINKFGCPKANVMGQCYIETQDKEFLGMVCTNSLKPLVKRGKHYFMKEE